MLDPNIPFDVDQYTVPERIAIIGAIWDTVDDNTELPLTPEQSAELERRYAQSLKRPLDDLIPWEDVKRRAAGGKQ